MAASMTRILIGVEERTRSNMLREMYEQHYSTNDLVIRLYKHSIDQVPRKHWKDSLNYDILKKQLESQDSDSDSDLESEMAVMRFSSREPDTVPMPSIKRRAKTPMSRGRTRQRSVSSSPERKSMSYRRRSKSRSKSEPKQAYDHEYKELTFNAALFLSECGGELNRLQYSEKYTKAKRNKDRIIVSFFKCDKHVYFDNLIQYMKRLYNDSKEEEDTVFRSKMKMLMNTSTVDSELVEYFAKICHIVRFLDLSSLKLYIRNMSKMLSNNVLTMIMRHMQSKNMSDVLAWFKALKRIKN